MSRPCLQASPPCPRTKEAADQPTINAPSGSATNTCGARAPSSQPYFAIGGQSASLRVRKHRLAGAAKGYHRATGGTRQRIAPCDGLHKFRSSMLIRSAALPAWGRIGRNRVELIAGSAMLSARRAPSPKIIAVSTAPLTLSLAANHPSTPRLVGQSHQAPAQ